MIGQEIRNFALSGRRRRKQNKSETDGRQELADCRAERCPAVPPRAPHPAAGHPTLLPPVAEVENGKDGGEDNPRDDVDLLGAGGEPIEPCLEEVVIPLLWLVHEHECMTISQVCSFPAIAFSMIWSLPALPLPTTLIRFMLI